MKTTTQIEGRLLNIRNCLYSGLYESDYEKASMKIEMETLNWVLKNDEKYTNNELMQEIINIITMDYGVKPKVLMKNHRTRLRSFTDMRQIYFYLCRKYTTATLAEIGSIFKKDHATVRHGIDNIKNIMEFDKEFNKRIKKFENYLTETLDKDVNLTETL